MPTTLLPESTGTATKSSRNPNVDENRSPVVGEAESALAISGRVA